MKYVPKVHGADRNDYDGAARAGGAVHNYPKAGVLVVPTLVSGGP